MDSESILGYPITRAGRDACVAQVHSWLDLPAGTPRFLFCVNPHSIMTARREPGFAAILKGADLCVPDGVGIVWASRLLGGNIRARLTGSDIFAGVMEWLNAGGRTCFLLGATDRTLDRMVERMARDYPSARVVGRCAPPFAEVFTQDENDRLLHAVNAAAPDVLWIGMTQPKQEKWAWENRHRLRAKVVIPIGAVFDFYSGRIRRPGSAAQRLGLEWLVRLSREPRRLWRRNLDSPLFLLWVLLDRLSCRSRQKGST